MLVLGIETSCDETAAAVVDVDGHVRSDVIHSQIAIHAPYGGIVPELASRDHLTRLDGVVMRALETAGVSFTDLGGIAVTCRPGLLGALLVGVQYGKALAFGLDLPLVGVDHLVGHLFSVFLQREGDRPARPDFPFVALLASGGHTALYAVHGDDIGHIQELGATRDDAAGEAFDKVAKLLGLGYPGGPRIDHLSTQGNAHRFELPKSLPGSLEFSFSGIKTQVARLIERGVIRVDLEQDVADACASFQRVGDRCTMQASCSELPEPRPAPRPSCSAAASLPTAVCAQADHPAKPRTARACGHACPGSANTTDNAAMIAYAGSAATDARRARSSCRSAPSRPRSLPRNTRKGRGERRDPHRAKSKTDSA